MRSDQKQILEEGGFTVVTKSKRNRRSNKSVKKAQIPSEDPPEDSEVARSKLLSRLLNEKKDFSPTEGFLRDFLSQLDTHLKDKERPRRVVSLGVGRFSECPIARTQLAFLLAVRDSFSGSRVSVFDPVHSDLERAVLGLLGLETLDSNCEGRFEVGDDGDSVQLFYLPHCPKQLSNNLLWANWSAEKLQKLVLVGNSFKRILLLSENVLKSEAEFVQRCGEFVQETEIGSSHAGHQDVFNDTSIHSFPAERLPDGTWALWERGPQPDYPESELELIRDV